MNSSLFGLVATLWLFFFNINSASIVGTSSRLLLDDQPTKEPTEEPAAVEPDLIAVTVPGAQCLYGDEFTYFIRPGNPEYVTIVLNGGGFCFDEATCPKNETIPTDAYFAFVPNLPLINGLPLNNEEDDLEWTIIIIPQCTEDFHVGSSENYPLDGVGGQEDSVYVNFVGGDNVRLILDEILSKDADMYEVANYVDFDEIEHLVLYGVSSGALGVITWGYQIFDYVSEDTVKTLVMDGYPNGDSLTTAFIPVLVGIYDFANSPAAASTEVLTMLATNSFTFTGLLSGLQTKYSDLYVSSLYFEYDTVVTAIYAFTFNDPSWFDPTVWTTHMLGTVIPETTAAVDLNRYSYYVSKGANHIFLFPNEPVSIDDITTNCELDDNAQEYLTQVFGDSSTTSENRDFPLCSLNSYYFAACSNCAVLT